MAELELIILDASVKWELTAWPLMDMANVAVSHLVAGPEQGGQNLTLLSFRGRHRVFPGMIDMVLGSLHHLLIFYRRDLFSDRGVPR